MKISAATLITDTENMIFFTKIFRQNHKGTSSSANKIFDYSSLINFFLFFFKKCEVVRKVSRNNTKKAPKDCHMLANLHI